MARPGWRDPPPAPAPPPAPDRCRARARARTGAQGNRPRQSRAAATTGVRGDTGFGLVHGFGFAAALAEICPTRTGLVASLLAFNVGVELGQVAIVAAALPLLSLLRRTVAYRRVVTSASAAILAVGVFWIFERAL